MNKIRSRLYECHESVRSAWKELQPLFEAYYPSIKDRFPEFTIHGSSHSLALETILDWLIPDGVWQRLKDEEVIVLLACLWAHDAGMGVGDEHVREYCDCCGLNYPVTGIEMQTFVRKHHADLGKIVVLREFAGITDGSLSALGNIAGDVARSHNYKELVSMPPMVPIGPGLSVRPGYLGIVLRLADILHCTADRAPLSLFLAESISDPVSVLHWKQHQCTLGVGLGEDKQTVLVNIFATEIEPFACAMHYCAKIQSEVDYCTIVAAQLGLDAKGLTVNARRVIEQKDTPNFLPEIVHLSVDTPAAIASLVGRNLYDDRTVVVRELIQNALDAVHLRKALQGAECPQGRVQVMLDTKAHTLVVEDNGIGMDLDDVKRCLLRSCSSGFRKSSDPKIIARYGIGFLTTLVVSNTIRVETRSFTESVDTGLAVTIKGAGDPVTISARSQCNPGTKVELQLRSSDLTAAGIRKWIPEPRDGIEIAMLVDNNLVSREEDNEGEVLAPFSLLPYQSKVEGNGMRAAIHGTSLIGIDTHIPCGLTFQSLEGLPASIVSLPRVSKRMFVGGIPLLSKSGDYPAYVVEAGQSLPLFERVYAPIDAYLDDSTKAELNLPRNALITSDDNQTTLDDLGVLCVELIANW